MIAFLTEIAEFLTAALMVSAAVSVLKKSDDIPTWNILHVEAK